MSNELAVLDFETEGIEDRPKYPPKPVGAAVWPPGRAPRYYSYGHPTDNGIYELVKGRVEKISDVCDERTTQLAVKECYQYRVLGHHLKFDLDVAESHWGLKPPPPQKVEDTMYLLFLRDPHASTLSLKPSAESILKLKPDERDAIRDWLVAHKVVARNASGHELWKNICKAPGSVVAPYAIGDLTRTKKLFDKILSEMDAGMLSAYHREKRLMPMLLDNERQGIRVNVKKLRRDLKACKEGLAKSEAWLRKRLNAPDLDFDKDVKIGDALAATKVVTDWVMTKGSKDGERAPQRSVSKVNLTIDRFNDKQVFYALGYRNRMQTLISMSMEPWLLQAEANNGRIFTDWNQVRHMARADGKGRGARTGRISCSRFMNIAKDFEDRGDGWTHPAFLKVIPLPLVRRYLLPDPGHVWVHLDYNQQEFRFTAHFEDGALLASYQANPRTDYHDAVQAKIKEMLGIDLDRRSVKVINFGILYGMGAALLAVKLTAAMKRPVSVEEARKLRAAVKRATPGVKALEDGLKEDGREGRHIRTWGGRKYFCEPPKLIEEGPRKGGMQTFEYKLLNYLVQGSAADCTKEALIRYYHTKKHGRLLVTVHDEINISVPKEHLKTEMAILRRAMESVEVDVPMLADAKIGPSWGDLKKVKESA